MYIFLNFFFTLVYFNEQLPVQIWIMFFFSHCKRATWGQNALSSTTNRYLSAMLGSLEHSWKYILYALVKWPGLYWGFTLFCIHTFNIDFIMEYNQTLWIGAQYFGTFRTFGFEFQEAFDNMLTCHLSLLILKWAKRQVSLFS